MKGVSVDDNFTNSQSEFIRTLFYENSTVPSQMLSEISQKIQNVFNGHNLPVVRYLKFRSSSNTEDVPGFDGAGLYDSYKIDLQAKDNVRKRKAFSLSGKKFTLFFFYIARSFVYSYRR